MWRPSSLGNRVGSFAAKIEAFRRLQQFSAGPSPTPVRAREEAFSSG
uniref:Uncharacterized protein n=1 Tax=Arundo donax TaxID=35708 RepID=A0A0A9G7H3_ARUDO